MNCSTYFNHGPVAFDLVGNVIHNASYVYGGCFWPFQFPFP